jgi:xanthine dehydrogenase YagS FAD-binding subunit
MALDAHTQIAYSEGIRAVPLREFFVTPGENLTQETVLQPNEILTGIKLPPPLPNARGIYLKVAERKATDFALASVALHLAWEGTRINHARVVLGSVAPVPWRLQHVEEILLGDELSQDFDKALPTPSKEKIQLACEGAVEGAKQIRHNGYKIPLVKGLLRKALRLVFESQLGTKIEEETKRKPQTER